MRRCSNFASFILGPTGIQKQTSLSESKDVGWCNKDCDGMYETFHDLDPDFYLFTSPYHLVHRF